MNQSIFRWLLGQVRSACDRTDLDGTINGIAFELRGRCSPYVSHRSVGFVPCENDGGRAMWICGRITGDGNHGEGFAIYFHSAPADDAEAASVWVMPEEAHLQARRLVVPSACLADLLVTLHGELGGLTPHVSRLPALMVVVVVRRRLVGWTDEGRPILAERAPPAEPLCEEQGRLEAAAREQPDLLVTLDDAAAAGYCDSGAREWLGSHGLPDYGFPKVRLADLAAHLGDPRVRRVCLAAIARASAPVLAVVE